ncbi:MAG: LamG domain-containing protein [Sedimentisphaerales bacterium]|nr:LamG domain-containing protein [Sedimentisphaerales bacterium]
MGGQAFRTLQGRRPRDIAVVGALTILVLASVGTADLSDGLLVYYPFAGNANDASANHNDGTASGATLTTDRLGAPDSAYCFDGLDDSISAPHMDAFNSATFTISAWVCPSVDLSAGAGAATVIARGEDFTTDHMESSLEIFGQDNPSGSGATLFYEDLADHDRMYCSGFFPEPDTWTHLAVTRALDGEVTLYSNATVIGHWYGTPNPATSDQELTIGARWWSPSTTGPYELAGFFSGAIDEVRLYDRALSADEIQDLIHAPIPGAAILGAIGLGYASLRLRRRNMSATGRV